MLSSTPPIDRDSLHPSTGYFIGPRVPQGLAAVVEGLAREVLRHHPEDIYVFAAHHFENLLKLREQYHTEEYSGHDFDNEFNREFNLWPTKESRDNRETTTSSWSLDLDSSVHEKDRKVPDNLEESSEDVSIREEEEKMSRQMCSASSSISRTVSKRSTKYNKETSDRATKIFSRMSTLHDHSKDIRTKDIKQELRRNKFSGEKMKASAVEKRIRNEGYSKTKISKSDKSPKEETEYAATASVRTSIRRPLKKVRRIDTESETETEHEIAAKVGAKNRHERLSDNKNREATGNGSREGISKSTTWLSEHSLERKVSSRALSMDRIRAYVLRKFASTASLEVLRSPTYVEQVQEVIDRAAPIIKEKLEEMRRPLGKRSKSVDLTWNMDEDSIDHRNVRDRRCSDRSDHEKEGRRRRKESIERKTKGNEQKQMNDIMKKEDAVKSPKMKKESLKKGEIISITEKEKPKSRKHSAGSGKRSKRRENGHEDFRIVDQLGDGSKQKNSSAIHDTLEARLTVTQNILEGISKSTSELSDIHKIDPVESEREPSELEASEHVNIVSLPIVRPPSSRNCKGTTRNGSDSVTLPPISPEAPKSTKKKDELSLPILPATNGNHSGRVTEQDGSRDVEEASTMRDITSDIEDIAILPEDEDVITDAKQNPTVEQQDLLLSSERLEETATENDADKAHQEYTSDKILEKRTSDVSLDQDFEELEKLVELGETGMEEVFKDSLNVTPEVIDAPQRPDSLEPIEIGELIPNDEIRNDMLDGLKGKLIEIEMAERSIAKALDGQQVASYNTDITSEVERSAIDSKINEAAKLTNKAEEIVSDIEKSINETEGTIDDGKMPVKKIEELNDHVKESTKVKEIKDICESLINVTEISTNSLIRSLKEHESVSNKTELMDQGKISVEVDKEFTSKPERLINESEKTIKQNDKLTNDVKELAVEFHREDVQSTDSILQSKTNQVDVIAFETEKENTTMVSNKMETATDASQKTTENFAKENEDIKINVVDKNSGTKSRKKREVDNLPGMTPLSLEIPFSYILSEGSPCEIPDFVTTVIIPDKLYQSPVIPNIKDKQFDTIFSENEESIEQGIVEEISSKQQMQNKPTSSKEIMQEQRTGGYGMDAFGEYIRPEVAVLPADIDFVRGTKGIKPSQDIVIVHQELDRIKEEGEEEEEDKKDDARGKEKHHQAKERDEKVVIQNEELAKIATLEDIMEYEESEETDIKTTSKSKDAEKINFSRVPEYDFLPDTAELTSNVDVTYNKKVDVIIESRSIQENSSEESGSTQDSHTTTSSDVKESTITNQSIESPSLSRPVVPELNLDSLQDNTISSFKTTANGTVTKESNDSLRESDATTSLIEPLTSDERLMVAKRVEEEIPIEGFMDSSWKDLQSEILDSNQLEQAEYAEYQWLERDSLSTETNLEDKIISQENVDLKILPHSSLQVGLILPERKDGEELGSEEEIAKELIGSLNEDIQFRAERLDSKKESNDTENGESNLSMNKKSSQLLSESVPLISIETVQEKHEISVETSEDKKDEGISKLSKKITDINQHQSSAIKDGEIEEVEEREKDKRQTKISQFTLLTELKPDKLLKQDDTDETTDKKSMIPDISDINHANFVNNKEKHEDNRASTAEILTSKSAQDISKNENLNDKLGEIKQKSPKNQDNNIQEKLESPREREEKSLQTQDDANQRTFETQKEIVDVKIIPSKIIDSRKDSLKDLIKNDEKEKEVENFLTEIDGSIACAVSEGSTAKHLHDQYSTMRKKSSTMETIIAAFDSNTSMDERIKTFVDVPKTSEDKSMIHASSDFYSAVVKIQACIRGFLTRHRLQKNKRSEPMSNNVSSKQNTVVDHSSIQTARTGKQRLRREEALRKLTLSLDNAFATSKLQHTGEFHDCVPLPLLDMIKDEIDSDLSHGSLCEEIEKNVEQAKPNSADSSDNDNYAHADNKGGTNFLKSNSFTDHSTVPIVMHLLTDTSHSKHFRSSQNPDSKYHSSTGMKPMETAVDILMLGYPRDDATLQNRYLNFITSVEDIEPNLDSLPSNDKIKTSKNVDDDFPSLIYGEGSLREPLALPGTPQGVVIEEVTSLDEAGNVSSELMKSSAALKINIREHDLKDKEDDLRKSLSLDDKSCIIKDQNYSNEESEAKKLLENTDCNLQYVGKVHSHIEDKSKKCSEISRNNDEHVIEGRKEKA